MKKSFLLLLSLITLINFSYAQWGNGAKITGNGVIKKETRTVSGFTTITVGSAIDLYLHQGNEERLEVEADENIIPAILTEVRGGTLKIYTEKSITKAKKMRVDVWFKDLRELNASGASDVYGEGQLSLSELSLNTSGGSDIELDLNVGQLLCSASGGSDIMLSGAAGFFDIQASGGSDIKAYDLQAGRCKIQASGGSDTYVTVNDELELEASGGSDVHYKGEAKITKMQVSGSADVHH